MRCEWVVLVVLVRFDEPVTGPSTWSPEVLGCRRRCSEPSRGSRIDGSGLGAMLAALCEPIPGSGTNPWIGSEHPRGLPRYCRATIAHGARRRCRRTRDDPESSHRLRRSIGMIIEGPY